MKETSYYKGSSAKRILAICMAFLLVFSCVAHTAASASSQANTQPHFFATALQEFFRGATGVTNAVLVDLNSDGVEEVVAVKVNENEGSVTLAVFDAAGGRNISVEATVTFERGLGTGISVYDQKYIQITIGTWGSFESHVFEYANGNLTKNIFSQVQINVPPIGTPIDMYDADYTYYHNGARITVRQYNEYSDKYGFRGSDFTRTKELHDSMHPDYDCDWNPRSYNDWITSHTARILAMTAPAPRPISVTLNGSPVSFDQQPIIENGRTLVPLRAIFEALGAEVTWNQSTQTATAVKDNITVTIKIGDSFLMRNGQRIPLDVPAQLVNNRTLIPARAVAEAFGATVNWDASTRTVIITD